MHETSCKVDFQLKTPVGDQLQRDDQTILVHHRGVSIASYSILSRKNIDPGIPSLSGNILKNFDFQDPRKISELIPIKDTFLVGRLLRIVAQIDKF